MKSLFFLLTVLVFAFFLLTYKNIQIPPGINGDEAGIGHNALLISRNLTDENDNFLPLFVFAKGSDWKQPVTVYSTALVFKIFGTSYFWLRATSALFVLLSLLILYFVSKEYGGFRFFLVSSFLFLTTPIIMIQSHLALENIAVLPFVFFWILMLLKFEDKNKPFFAYLAGASLGVGIFSYYGMRLVVPVLVALSLLYLKRHRISFLIGCLPFFALLLAAYFRYPGAVIGNFEAPAPTVYEFFHRYLSSFDLSFLFFRGDATAYHSTGRFGMLLLPTFIPFVFGVQKAIRSQKPFLLLVVLGFFLTPLLFGFVPEFHRASRLLAIIPFYIIISAVGLVAMQRFLAFGVLVLIGISHLFFLADYWYEYPKRVKEAFPIPIERTYEFYFKE